MGAKFHGPAGHQSAGAFYDYETPEQLHLGLGDGPEFCCADGRIARAALTKEQFRNLALGKSFDGTRQLRRHHPRQKEGEAITFTLHSSVTAAMKAAGLLDNPKLAFQYLLPAARKAMARLNRHAYGRTTGGKLVKVDFYYAITLGFRTRAGEVSPQVTCYVFNHGRAATGKLYALAWRSLYRAQQEVQAVYHLGVTHELGRNAGILCVPHRHSFRALGVDRTAKTARAKEMDVELKRTGRKGPKARTRAARKTRGPKPKVSWAEAVNNTVASVSGKIQRTVTRLADWQEERFARACVHAGVRYCARNAPRITTQDIFAAAAHIAIPHVSPEVFEKVFQKEQSELTRLGLVTVNEYPDKNVVYAPLHQARFEGKAVQTLARHTERKSGALKAEKVAKALAARGYTRLELTRVGRFAHKGGVSIDDSGLLTTDKKTLRGLTEAYERNKKDVHLVGPGLGGSGLSPKDFASSLIRTSHLTALWRGLRSPGPLSQKLWVAEQIRKNSHQRLKKGSLVVLDCPVTEAQSLSTIAREVAKARGKLVLTGPHAKEISQRVQTVLLQHRHHHHHSRGNHR